MMKKISLFLLLISLFSFQSIEKQKPVHTIGGDFDFFTTDNLGNVYLVRNDELSKYQDDYLLQYTFSSKLYGQISGIDFNFPLKPTLFYEDIRQMLMLDNTLSIQGAAISLEDYDLEQSTIACASINNNYWFFNQLEFSLERINPSFETIQKTENLNQQLNVDLQPNFMVERDDWVYVNNPETGILVFDLFGAYLKTIPITGLDYFQCIGNVILYAQENSVLAYDMKNFETREVFKSEKSLEQVRVEKEKLYLLSEDGLSIYKIEKE